MPNKRTSQPQRNLAFRCSTRFLSGTRFGSAAALGVAAGGPRRSVAAASYAAQGGPASTPAAAAAHAQGAAAIAAASPAAAPSATAAAGAGADRQGLLNQYCASCHNDRLKTAGMSVQKLDADNIERDLATWEKI